MGTAYSTLRQLDPHNQKKGDANQSRNQIKKAKAKLKT